MNVRDALRRRRAPALLLGLLVFGGRVAAQDGADALRLGDWAACRERQAVLELERGALYARAQRLAAARAAAIASGDRRREEALLVIGEAVADSLRAFGAAALAQELVCERMAEALRGKIERQLAAALEPGAVGRGERDSLELLAAALREVPRRSVRAEFTVPQVGSDAPPELLRQSADFARDLADRAARWQGAIEQLRTQLQRARLAEERRDLLGDQRFLDDLAAIERPLLGSGWEDRDRAPSGGLVPLLARLPEEGTAGLEPEAVLELLDEWLGRRRAALLDEADRLARAAALREERQ